MPIQGAVSASGRPNLPSFDGRSVCLITPPSAFLLDERVFVSLGILKVAASLEARNWRVNLLDLSGVGNFLSPLEDYLATCQDAAIGITATTPQLPSVMQIAQTIKRLRPTCGSFSAGRMSR